MRTKVFKKQKDLIKTAVRNKRVESDLTYKELKAKNILILNGIRNPSKELIQKALRNIK